jgi:hypothetical protein
MFDPCITHQINQGLGGDARPFFMVRPAGRTHFGVKVPYGPGKGNR